MSTFKLSDYKISNNDNYNSINALTELVSYHYEGVKFIQEKTVFIRDNSNIEINDFQTSIKKEDCENIEEYDVSIDDNGKYYIDINIVRNTDLITGIKIYVLGKIHYDNIYQDEYEDVNCELYIQKIEYKDDYTKSKVLEEKKININSNLILAPNKNINCKFRVIFKDKPCHFVYRLNSYYFNSIIRNNLFEKYKDPFSYL